MATTAINLKGVKLDAIKDNDILELLTSPLSTARKPHEYSPQIHRAADKFGLTIGEMQRLTYVRRLVAKGAFSDFPGKNQFAVLAKLSKRQKEMYKAQRPQEETAPAASEPADSERIAA